LSEGGDRYSFDYFFVWFLGCSFFKVMHVSLFLTLKVGLQAVFCQDRFTSNNFARSGYGQCFVKVGSKSRSVQRQCFVKVGLQAVVLSRSGTGSCFVKVGLQEVVLSRSVYKQLFCQGQFRGNDFARSGYKQCFPKVGLAAVLRLFLSLSHSQSRGQGNIFSKLW